MPVYVDAIPIYVELYQEYRLKFYPPRGGSRKFCQGSSIRSGGGGGGGGGGIPDVFFSSHQSIAYNIFVKFHGKKLGVTTNGPCRDKTCLLGFRQNDIQTSLLSYRDQLENWNFAGSKSRYNTIHLANNKGTDQTALMRRLVCAFVVRKPLKTGFLASRPKCYNEVCYRGTPLYDNMFLFHR